MQQLPNALASLSAYKQFTLYKKVQSKTRPGKVDKFPCNICGDVVDAHDSKHWVTVDEAIAAATIFGEPYGVGFVFTPSDPFFFLDIDGAWDGKQWSELAQKLINSMQGCAVEVSQSNTGLHIFGTYQGDEPDHACKNIPLGIELYTSGRFCALTGINATGDASHNGTEQLNTLITDYFPFDSTVDQTKLNWTTTHVRGESQPITDDIKLIERACATVSPGNVFGGEPSKASFNDLWTRNVPVLSQVFPSETGQEFDTSSADAAMAQHLIWWCGGNCERVDRLMRMSALKRDKWDNHKSYMSMTITSAASRCADYYNPARDTVVREVNTIEVDETMREGVQIMTADQQLEYFKGCTYITEYDKIFTPNGSMLNQSRFNAYFGGYNFNVDFAGEKTTKKAWEAFTESQTINFPKVDTACFRPQLESGTLLREYSKSMVNTYVDINAPCEQGDVTPFLDHVTKLLPDARDREILLSYMAACIQHKGHKIQWAPVIQGAEGNGKTIFTMILMHALGRPYTHLPQAEDIDNKFNSWLVGKLFIGVEEIYVPGHRANVLETLKPMITNADIGVQFKGADQVTKDICCNFLFTTNHKDAIPLTVDNRRYAIFYTAQQDHAGILRDGMSGDYFPNLYGWLNAGGYAYVTHYLQSYQIADEFNPTTQCQRAPETSSTMEAVVLSLGTVEQEILEAIEEGRRGFCGGWISSFAVDKLLVEMRKDKAVPRNKRRLMLQKLGYDYHPGLNEGRVNNAIACDNGKPRLFIKVGHILSNIEGPAEIARAYAKAQGEIFSVDNNVNKSYS